MRRLPVLFLSVIVGCGKLSFSPTQVRTSFAIASGDAAKATVTCPTGSFCFDAKSLSGSLASAVLVVGDGSDGRAPYRLPVVGFANPEYTDAFSEQLNFSVADGKSIEGSFSCCTAARYPADSAAVVTQVELYFHYLDIQFDSLTPFQALKMRFPLAQMDSLGYQRGDLLLEKSGSYLWCHIGAGCVYSTRPTAAASCFSDECNGAACTTLAARKFNFLGARNKSIIAITAKPASRVELKEKEITTGRWKFKLGLPMKNAVAVTYDLALCDAQTKACAADPSKCPTNQECGEKCAVDLNEGVYKPKAEIQAQCEAACPTPSAVPSPTAESVAADLSYSGCKTSTAACFSCRTRCPLCWKPEEAQRSECEKCPSAEQGVVCSTSLNYGPWAGGSSLVVDLAVEPEH